jgi:hypothetical protein
MQGIKTGTEQIVQEQRGDHFFTAVIDLDWLFCCMPNALTFIRTKDWKKT